jgi:medium-chain acyl-[acyl-carrier-protein] hydrolase
MKLACFAGAGRTTALFAPWQALVPGWLALVPIEMPGRGARSEEAPVASMPALIDRLLPEVDALGERVALFGHSLGAKIAFELARRLPAEPVHLFVAASPSRRFPSWGRGLHLAPRDELIAEVKRLAGSPPRLFEDRALVDLLLPRLRADLQLAVEYDPLPGPPLRCPLTAFAGARDPDIIVHDVAGWRRHTRGAFQLRTLDAGHHFVRERAGEIVGDIVRALHQEGP